MYHNHGNNPSHSGVPSPLLTKVSIMIWAPLKKSPNCASHRARCFGLSMLKPYSYPRTASSFRGQLATWWDGGRGGGGEGGVVGVEEGWWGWRRGGGGGGGGEGVVGVVGVEEGWWGWWGWRRGGGGGGGGGGVVGVEEGGGVRRGGGVEEGWWGWRRGGGGGGGGGGRDRARQKSRVPGRG